MQTPLNMVMNPTDGQRYQMLMNELSKEKRTEDYEYIIKYLSPPPDITEYAAPGELRGKKIGIIGGGLAGMAAAYELRKLGAEITIFDASKDRIGGRVYTWYFNKTSGCFGELGAMRIPVSHETTWHYINLFGLNTIPLTSPQDNNFIYVHNTRIRRYQSVEDYLYPLYNPAPRKRITPWQDLLSYAIRYAYLRLPPPVRSELIRILPEYSPEALKLMNISLRENFEALGLSQGAINMISAVTPENGALLHISYDEIAHEAYTMDYRNLYRIDGGNINLPYAFYNSFFTVNVPGYENIPKSMLGSVCFRQGHCVTGIYKSGYRSKVVVKYSISGNGRENADIFDFLICAIPYSRLRLVEIRPYFSNIKMQAILELNYIDAFKCLFLCNRRFWEKQADYGRIIGGISFTDLPIQSIIYPNDHIICPASSACPHNEPGVLTFYNLNKNSVRLGGLNEQSRFEAISRNAEEVHGLPRGYINSAIEGVKAMHWNAASNYLGALVCTLPGQKPLFSYAMRQPEYNNRVFFAGEHVSTKHGWIQGALYSGKYAANQLAMYYGSTTSSV